MVYLVVSFASLAAADMGNDSLGGKDVVLGVCFETDGLGNGHRVLSPLLLDVDSSGRETMQQRNGG